MNAKKGFTVIEVIIAVAIIGVLASVGIINYNVWRNKSLVSEAAYQIAQDIEKIRSDAKRLNETRQLTFTAPDTGSNNVITSYSKKDAIGSVISTSSLPAGVKVYQVKEAGTAKTATTLSFTAPYGTQSTAISYYDIVVQSLASSSVSRTVRIIGPLGKVVIL